MISVYSKKLLKILVKKKANSVLEPALGFVKAKLARLAMTL